MTPCYLHRARVSHGPCTLFRVEYRGPLPGGAASWDGKLQRTVFDLFWRSMAPEARLLSTLVL